MLFNKEPLFTKDEYYQTVIFEKFNWEKDEVLFLDYSSEEDIDNYDLAEIFFADSCKITDLAPVLTMKLSHDKVVERCSKYASDIIRVGNRYYFIFLDETEKIDVEYAADGFDAAYEMKILSKKNQSYYFCFDFLNIGERFDLEFIKITHREILDAYFDCVNNITAVYKEVENQLKQMDPSMRLLYEVNKNE